MTSKILLAILLGFVLRFLARLGILHYLKSSMTIEEMRKLVGFHISVSLYVAGTILKYGGGAFLAAYLIKEHLL